MHLHKTVARVSDAAIIRAVFPRHPVKSVARLLGLSISAAHEWTYRRLSNARRRELAEALLQEMDRQEVARTALRRRLAAWAAEQEAEGGRDAEMGGAAAGLDCAQIRAEEATR